MRPHAQPSKLPGSARSLLCLRHLCEHCVPPHSLHTVPHAPAVSSGVVSPHRPLQRCLVCLVDRANGANARLHRINDNFCELLESGPKPTVAAIEGVALGGGLETALACNARLCSPGAATHARWVAVMCVTEKGAGWHCLRMVRAPST